MVLCQPDELVKYWNDVSEALANLKRKLFVNEAKVLICGGDTILAELKDNPSPQLIYELLSNTSPIGFSVGTGRTMLEAHIALKTAKASGKGCWIDYHDLTSIRKLQQEFRESAN